MLNTKTLSLNKIELTDFPDITVINPNWDTIDSEIQELKNSKVEKVVGKTLSTNDYTTEEKQKLEGVAVNANNYIHPNTHPANAIVQDESNRFVTDEEKRVWNEKSNQTHVHDDRYYTETEVDALLSKKSNSSHGNHVPSTQTINNSVFLRNDNTWASVTPANIGASPSNHVHNYLPLNGGTVTDNVHYTMYNSTQIPMKIYGGDSYGQGLSIGAGGATIISSGEGKDKLEENMSPGVEVMTIGSDQTIQFYSALQNGWTSSKQMIMGMDGKLTNANGFVGNIEGNASTSTQLETVRGFTIGNTTKKFDGSCDVSWSMAEIGAIPTTASCNKNWSWSGKIGQPSWVWGGEDGTNMYVYSPSNFNVNYANSSGYCSGNSETANTSNYLTSNARMDYGWNGLNYFNINGTVGNSAKANDTPTTEWWHMMRFNHANATGYYTDLAIPFNDTSMYYKRISGGTVQNGGWVKILDSLNYTSYVPTKTGSGASGTWDISVSGNAATATKLQTTKTINGVSFDGSNNITITAAANGGNADTVDGKHAADFATSWHTHNNIINTGIAQLHNYEGLTISDTNGASDTGYKSNYSQILNLKSSSGTTQIINETEWDVPNLMVRQKYLEGEWSPFYSIYHSGYKPKPSDIGALPVGGNAETATKLQTARSISLSGQINGSASFDGSGNITITTSEGDGTIASGQASHAEGSMTKAAGNYSHAEGQGTTASGQYSHAEGARTVASGYYAHAEGSYSEATGDYSHAEGASATAETYCTHAQGRYNKINDGTSSTYSATNNAFVIGNGSYATKSNAFRVNFSGGTYGLSAFNSTGADYAEYFEWEDGNINNEDRIGRFVTLNGNKIKFANSEEDYVVGIISGNQSIIGNACEDGWNDMYLRDEFGRLQYEDVEAEQEVLNKEASQMDVKTVTEHRIKLNPNYISSEEYIPRSERKEWGVVGMLGQIIVRDDGTCEVNKFCKPSDGGIATYSEDKAHYRVIERINDNLIKVIMR